MFILVSSLLLQLRFISAFQLKDLPESELGPVEGYPPDEPLAVDEDEEPLSDRLKKCKSSSDVVAAGSQKFQVAKKFYT